MTLRQSDSSFLSQSRAIVTDLYTHNPFIYWVDFFLSLIVGLGCAIVYLNVFILPLQIVCFLIAGAALYRVSLFMHEIVHFRQGEMPFFSLAWNLLAGVPMLIPSYFYEPHRDHHRSNHYGTIEDGEYLPLGNGRLRDIWLFMAQVFIQPILIVFRFAILTPISFLHPKLRRWVLEHASSFVINWRYHRTLPDNRPHLAWAVMDVFCSIRIWVTFILVGLGVAPIERLPMLYLLATFILALNYVRTLAAHRYKSRGERMTHVEQLLDSIDITGDRVFTELLCPVGLRYHALHHLFPSVPYHNLGIAHRRLMEQLPDDSPYREVVKPSLWSVLRRILSDAASHSRTPDPPESGDVKPDGQPKQEGPSSQEGQSSVRLAEDSHPDGEPANVD